MNTPSAWDPAAQGEILFYPDYPQHNPPVWREEIAVSPEALSGPVRADEAHGVFRRAWRQPERHTVGGSHAWLEATSGGRTVTVPSALAPAQAEAIAPVYEAIRGLVGDDLWRSLMARYEAFQTAVSREVTAMPDTSQSHDSRRTGSDPVHGAGHSGGDADDIPEQVLHRGRQCLLDFLGVALGAAGEPAIGIQVETARSLRTMAACTLLGRTERVDALWAALINGSMAHLLDFDDTHSPTILHGYSAILAAELALCESFNAPVPGSRFLTAFLAGYETSARVALSLHPAHYDRGWHVSGTAGAFGAAAACGWLLGLSPGADGARAGPGRLPGGGAARDVRVHEQVPARGQGRAERAALRAAGGAGLHQLPAGAGGAPRLLPRAVGFAAPGGADRRAGAAGGRSSLPASSPTPAAW